jgi:hypothetical protein
MSGYHMHNFIAASNKYLDGYTMKSFAVLPYVKIAIYILLALTALILILRVFKIKTIFRSKGVTSELSNVNDIKSRDKYLLRSNKILKVITTIVQSTPFGVAQASQEYYQAVR